ncbi:hypothetical protein MASR2M117_25770 [Paludibacter sp.]
MKKVFLSLILVLIFTVLPAKTIKLLTIGNSFSEDAVEQYLYDLAKASGDTIIIGNMYIGGAALSLHNTNSVGNVPAYSYRKIVNGVKTTTESYMLSNAFKNEDWDYISFQQASPNSGQYNTFFPYITNLITYAKGYTTNPAVKFILHATWAYAQNSTHDGFNNYSRNQMTMYNSIIDATSRVLVDANMDMLVPAGTAIQNGRTSSLGDTFCRDGYHLELTYGRFTAACTWYEKLFEKSVIENSYAPASITPFQAKVAKHAAHNAVLKPTEVTSLADLTNDIVTVPFTKQINLSFASVPEVSGWNVLADFNLNAKVENLRDKDGDFTPVQVMVVDRFGGINTNGPTSTITDMNLPSGATSQSFFGNVNAFGSSIEPTAAIRFSSLDINQTYNFKIFASRMSVSDNRETEYKFFGQNLPDTTIYLNVSNNTTNYVQANNIKPNINGEIDIKMTVGPNNNNANKFYYINALQISPNLMSVVNNLQNKSIEIYPNPFADFINIKSSERIDNISIYSVDWKNILFATNLNKESSLTISTKHMASGSYIVLVDGKSSILIKK